MKITAIFLALILSGCATNAEHQNPQCREIMFTTPAEFAAINLFCSLQFLGSKK